MHDTTVPDILPLDEHNNILISNARPPGYVNPKPAEIYNLVAIGAGTAGLVSAGGTALLGGKAALIERNLMGGDCLNTGCVPSKALIRCARAASEVRKAHRFGISGCDDLEIDFSSVMEYVRRVRAAISFHDSVERFRKYGVDVFLGNARFERAGVISVNGIQIHYKKAVISTGARPVTPKVQGLEHVEYLTNETIFNLTVLPKRLAIIGGGPLGCEFAQAFARLGAEVFLFHNKTHILDREDPDVAEILEEQFKKEGIRLILNSEVKEVLQSGGRKIVRYFSNDKEEKIEIDELLVGAGRSPNVEGLNLESAGVAYDLRKGVWVNERLQTTNRNIYAAGDVCMDWKFTHAAEAAGRIVIQNALFGRNQLVSKLVMPWCTYTDPEVAHVGLNEKEAGEKGIRVRTYYHPFNEVDRAVTDGVENGFIKLHLKDETDKIMGATIVCAHAGELINEITLAISAKIGLKQIFSLIHPYPTLAEAIRHVADMYNQARLTPLLKRLIRAWLSYLR